MKSSLLFFFSGWKGGEGRREGRGGGRDAVNVHLSCAISHSNASKLDAVLIDQCFTVFGGEKREERREKRQRERVERREKREERREKREEGKKEERKRASKKEKEDN